MDRVGRALAAVSRPQPPSTAGPTSAGAAIKNSAAIAPSLSHLRCRAFIYTAPSTSARIALRHMPQAEVIVAGARSVVYSLLAEARKKQTPVTAGQRSTPAAAAGTNPLHCR